MEHRYYRRQRCGRLATYKGVWNQQQHRIDDLSCLAHSPLIRSVVTLALQGTDIDNLDFLSDAYELRKLGIEDMYIADISVLGNLDLQELLFGH